MNLVVAEVRAGGLVPASLEALAGAQALGGPVTVAAVGADVVAALEALGTADVAERVAVEHPALELYTPDGFVSALTGLIAELRPDWVVFPHTYQARDFVPALAARLGRALVTDCTGVKATESGVVLTRPMFRGKVVAEVEPQGDRPYLVTFQTGVFRADSVIRAGAGAAIRRVRASIDPGTIRQRPEAPFQEARQAVDLTQAVRIVAVGRGIKDRDHLAMAQALATALGAELAASRPVCDAGWMPMERQVGSSGQTVAPELYVALGISGAIQHIVGMRGAKTIVAVNRDPEAPIFEIADYGIVGDLFDVVPALIEALKT